MTKPNRQRQQCTALTARGKPCRAWAIPGTDPPLCSAHSGHAGGAPPGNVNAVTHGLYQQPAPNNDIHSIIADLAKKQRILSAYIDVRLLDPETTPADITRLLALHAATATRLGRLLRDELALSGEASTDLDAAISIALDELSGQLGIPL
jgi:uncharacterized protein YjcR